MALSAAAIAKIATTVATNDKLRKGVGWIVAAILSPLILFLVLLCALLSATSQHNNAAVDLCFYGGNPPVSAPLEYQDHIQDMQSAFAIVDGEVARVNAMVEGSTGLDVNDTIIVDHSDNEKVYHVAETLYNGGNDIGKERGHGNRGGDLQ